MKQLKTSFYVAGEHIKISLLGTKYSWVLAVIVAGILMASYKARAQGEARPTTNSTASIEGGPAEKNAFQEAMKTFLPAMDAQDSGKAVDFVSLREAMAKYWIQFPTAHHSVTLLTFYMNMFTKAHPDRVQAEWGSFTQSNSPMAADLARGKVRFFELSEKPFRLTFVALDGRLVDLDQLRGKPVLIDFWATWCVPCVKEMPLLKHLYGEYHKKGFEIVGVSLDRQEDKSKLIDFISENGLIWPQCFDGKVWQNEFAVRYAVNSAPTTFLLDEEGKLVGIDLERDKLESEIKWLLGIPQHPK